MFGPIRTVIAPAGLAIAIVSSGACATAQPQAQAGGPVLSAHANSIQPETTLNITASASVTRAPDIAFINAGVETQADTADVALADNAQRMNGVFAALKSAGVKDRNIQTSNFSISPRYNYEERGSARLDGYTASNTVRAKITDLETLGATIDALVKAGGNTLNGVTFGLEDDTEERDEARRDAIKTATERAKLYADAAGYRVARIVSISEAGGYDSPQPVVARARLSEAAPSPVSGGELDFGASVNVVFELEKK